MEEPSTTMTMTMEDLQLPGPMPIPRPTPMLHQPTPDEDDLDLEDSDDDENKKDQTMAGKNKPDAQTWFIEKATLDNVLVDEHNPIKVGRQQVDTTHLQSIEGCPSKKLTTKCLQRFCVVHQIFGYKNKSKTFLCNLIVERMKTQGLDTNMYPEDFEAASKNLDTTGKNLDTGGKNLDPTPDNASKKASKKKTTEKSPKKPKKLSRNAKPPAVTKDGSYWRAIATYFLQPLRPHVVKLGNNPDIQKIDSHKFLHEDIWNILGKHYNKPDHPDLKTFHNNNSFYQSSLIPDDTTSNFNTLTPMELSQLMSHIHFHYRKAVRKQRTSGSHWPITKYIGARPWLLLYHKSLQESSIEMKAFVSGNLPDGVGGSSLKQDKYDNYDTDSDVDKKAKNGKQSRGKPSPRGKPESEKLRVARAMESFGAVHTLLWHL
jgi:hypothetical protein